MKNLIVMGIILICIGLMYLYPHAMLNPGDLIEGHQELDDRCVSCHNPFWGIPNGKCISCHRLADIGRDTLNPSAVDTVGLKVLFHQHLSGQQCTSCHTDHIGRNPEKSMSGFGHEVLPVNVLNDCNSCHARPTDDLHGQLTTACNKCHGTKDWKSPTTFDHGMIQGGATVDCASCHKSPDDAFHLKSKDNCDKCHGTGQWKPSTFDHSIYFRLDRDHSAECNKCHTDNDFSAYTCYGCHEHSEGEIADEHHGHGIFDFNDCTSCHRSADEDDIRMNGNSNRQLDPNELNDVKTYIGSPEKKDKKKPKEKREHDDD